MSEVKVNKISPKTACGTVTVGDSGDSVTVSSGVPVTVNGDLKSNALKATDGGIIVSQSGTTITLGASGDTVTLASGASQTGFGRTGTVNWDTTKKTAGFTGVSGNGYFVDTTSGAITVNLPASPSAGDIMAIADYAGTANSNNINIGRNSSNIEGSAADGVININRESKTMVYVDATQGWVAVNDNADGVINPEYVAATGGSVVTSGDFKIHAFTSPGTFCVSSAGNGAGSNKLSNLLVVAGGGGGGFSDIGGAGGAGGLRNIACVPIAASPYPITVGGGGASKAATGSVPCFGPGGTGSNSVAISYTGAGGGYGAGGPWGVNPGGPGGSGGGAGDSPSPDPPSTHGVGNTPPVSPPQGNPGSGAYCGTGGAGIRAGSGGGASCAAGQPGGGAGLNVAPFFGSAPQPFYQANQPLRGNTACGQFAGGGGAGGDGPPGKDGGVGGVGGGGKGSSPGNNAGQAGTTNSGGGGGGAENTRNQPSGAGGSGIVLIKYKFQN